jgi:hypothetical protein
MQGARTAGCEGPKSELRYREIWQIVLSGLKKEKKRILFFNNEARKLLKTKGGCGKNGQNEPKTNRKRS